MKQEFVHAIAKRGHEAITQYELPGWAWGFVLLDILIYVPMLLIVSYTWNTLYPVLAMIEDPAPPAYEPVALADDPDSAKKAGNSDYEAARPSGSPVAVTSSFRRIGAHLKTVGGCSSKFRGLACYAFLHVVGFFLISVITAGGMLPTLLMAPVAAIALLQIDTAWLHIVISQPSDKHFWQRLPAFKKVFKAAAFPAVMHIISLEVAGFAPHVYAAMIGAPIGNPEKANESMSACDAWKFLSVLVVSLALNYCLVVPTSVILVRVQASLLPEEDETIVPFDRSFQGRIEPAVVGGKGYATAKDAWVTFSRSSWTRLFKLYVKIFAAGVAVMCAYAMFVAPQAYFIMAHAKKVEGGS